MATSLLPWVGIKDLRRRLLVGLNHRHHLLAIHQDPHLVEATKTAHLQVATRTSLSEGATKGIKERLLASSLLKEDAYYLETSVNFLMKQVVAGEEITALVSAETINSEVDAGQVYNIAPSPFGGPRR
jgi:hypothetical protein